MYGPFGRSAKSGRIGRCGSHGRCVESGGHRGRRSSLVCAGVCRPFGSRLCHGEVLSHRDRMCALSCVAAYRSARSLRALAGRQICLDAHHCGRTSQAFRDPGLVSGDRQRTRLISRRSSSALSVWAQRLHPPISCAVRLLMTCCVMVATCRRPCPHTARVLPRHLGSPCVYDRLIVVLRICLGHFPCPSR